MEMHKTSIGACRSEVKSALWPLNTLSPDN